MLVTLVSGSFKNLKLLINYYLHFQFRMRILINALSLFFCFFLNKNLLKGAFLKASLDFSKFWQKCEVDVRSTGIPLKI